MNVDDELSRWYTLLLVVFVENELGEKGLCEQSHINWDVLHKYKCVFSSDCEEEFEAEDEFHLHVVDVHLYRGYLKEVFPNAKPFNCPFCDI